MKLEQRQFNFPHRAVFCVNQYISGIQAGIQAMHCQAQIGRNLEQNLFSEAKAIYNSWADHHKIIHVLNGGMQSNLKKIRIAVLNAAKKFQICVPNGIFREEEDALNGALTCVGFIVPNLRIQNNSFNIPVSFEIDGEDFKFNQEGKERDIWLFQEELKEILPRRWAH